MTSKDIKMKEICEGLYLERIICTLQLFNAMPSASNKVVYLDIWFWSENKFNVTANVLPEGTSMGEGQSRLHGSRREKICSRQVTLDRQTEALRKQKFFFNSPGSPMSWGTACNLFLIPTSPLVKNLIRVESSDSTAVARNRNSYKSF